MAVLIQERIAIEQVERESAPEPGRQLGGKCRLADPVAPSTAMYTAGPCGPAPACFTAMSPSLGWVDAAEIQV